MQKKLIILLFFLADSLFSMSQVPSFRWARGIGGIDLDYCEAITTDDTANVYTTGYFEKTVDFDPGPATYLLTCGSLNYDPYVYKLDSAGKFVWAKQFKGASTIGGKGLAIKLDASNNVYVTGQFSGTVDFDPGAAVYNLTAVSESDVFVAKLDPAGNFVWAKQFKGNAWANIGTSIDVDISGDIIVTGSFISTVDFDPGPAVFNITAFGLGDIFVVKLTSSGSLIWAKQLGGTEGDGARSLMTDSYGNVVITGNFQATADFDPGPGVFNLISVHANGDAFICKLDPSGNLVWAKNFSAYESMQINIDGLDNIVTIGNFGGTVDFDPGPGVYTLTAAELSGFINRWDKNGNFINAFALITGPPAPNHNFSLRGVDQDAASNIYLTGFFLGEIDFDPGPGTYTVNSPYQPLSFVCKLSSTGNHLWTSVQQTTYYAAGFSLALDTLRNVHVCGFFGSNITFDPGPSPIVLTANGDQDFFVAKLNRCTNVTTSSITTFACNSYTLNGHTYTVSGVYTQIINNAAGCDSIITLNLTVGGSNDTTNITACDNYTWQGNTYTISGFYRDTLVASDGCDSILNLNLAINHTVQTTVNAAICQGQTYAGHSTTGTYIDTYMASNGCDSIRTLHLTVSPILYSSVSATICQGQQYMGHTNTGIFKDTLVSVFGCDSIVTLNLTVNPVKFTNQFAVICEGQSYYAGGALQTSSGIYKDTLLTSLGCDSVITTTLTVHPAPRPNLGPDRNLCADGSTASISPGIFNSYLWQDNSALSSFSITAPGLYWVTVTDNNNCLATDSLRVLALDTIPRNFLPANKQVCFGSELKLDVPGYQNYLWSNGETTAAVSLRSFGIFYLTVTDFNNCTGTDSIRIIRANCIPIAIPNAFTPNADGRNDIFRPTINHTILAYHFVLYNRYGERIFETFDYGTGWDGTYKGKLQQSGSYVYRIRFTSITGWQSDNNGSVLLIR